MDSFGDAELWKQHLVSYWLVIAFHISHSCRNHCMMLRKTFYSIFNKPQNSRGKTDLPR